MQYRTRTRKLLLSNQHTTCSKTAIEYIITRVSLNQTAQKHVYISCEHHAVVLLNNDTATEYNIFNANYGTCSKTV